VRALRALTNPQGAFRMTRTTIIIAAALAFAAVLPAAPALAQRDRVFVASYGSDSNPCTFGSPCKTFQNAVNVVAQGGEVTAIDSAGFGPMTISHAVTITSPAGVEAGIAVASGAAGITINAGASDLVRLSGLEIGGAGAGSFGVLVNSAGRLDIMDSKIEDFSSTGANGLYVPPTANVSNITITNTHVSNNYVGLGLSGNQKNLYVTMDHVTVTGSTSQFGGVAVNATNNEVNLTISNGIFTDNNVGIKSAGDNGAFLFFSNLVFGGNTISMFLNGASQLFLSRVSSMSSFDSPNMDIQISGMFNSVNSDGTNHIGSVNPTTTPSQWSNY
jgi:hypothetical protein